MLKVSLFKAGTGYILLCSILEEERQHVKILNLTGWSEAGPAELQLQRTFYNCEPPLILQTAPSLPGYSGGQLS